ncbi:hypothetical protein GW926_03750 [Candidatus Pacearchaeota archaeon]|nr:hypothetical protein [Candidatus Pacearchaeota archaeon]
MIPIIFMGVSFFNGAKSASLTSVSVTLSNPRLSFRGSLDGNNVVGTSQVSINTSSGHPSLSTAQLQGGDSIAIGEGNSLGTYTVSTTNPNSEFTLASTLAAGDADLNDDVISTQSAALTVRFTTATAINNGRFRILVPALASNTDSADGIPDSDLYDFGSSAPTVTCPTDISGYDFVAGTATASAITISSVDYHSYECAYSGTGGVGSAFDGTTNAYITISNVINPAPESGHTTGTADTQNIIIQHLDSSFNVDDSTAVAVGVIEAVKVSASVPASISFSIAGVAASTSTCGITTDVTTTAAAVPFGEVSLSSFNNAAQTLTVTTNAVNGYAVTAIENDQLGLDGATCSGDNTGNSCIRDSAGDDTLMSHTTIDNWDDTANKGFAYSIHNVDAALVPFQYNTVSGNCVGGSFCAKQFADAEDSQVAQEIFSSTTVADSQNINVCYRVIPDVVTAAGDYENYVTYTATATF